jgi:pimeloyl-ACP methyl ester carboxylesterase
MLTWPETPSDAADYIERTVITDDGVRLAVRDYCADGTAKHTVVLLHGLSLSQEIWESQIEALQQRWGDDVRVITYDHRGHGRSGGAAMDTYRVDQLGADLAAVLAALDVTGPLTLAGHSMGGMTALAYLGRPAQGRPVEPQGLVLIASAAGRLSERGIGRLLATPATGALFELVRRMPRRGTDRAIQTLIGPLRNALSSYAERDERNALAAVAQKAVGTTSLSTLAGFLLGLKRYDEYRTLASITAKTVVLSGGADRLTPPSHARDIAASVPGAVHLQHPTAGHMLLQDAPEFVTGAINRAMSAERRSGRGSHLAVVAS